jgi:hypothetical protein
LVSKACRRKRLTIQASLSMLRTSKFYEDIIKVEDAFPVRLADNRLIGPSVHRFGFSGQRLAVIGR